MNLNTLKGFFSGTDFLRPNRFKIIFHTNFAKAGTVRGELDKFRKTKVGGFVKSGVESIFGTDIGNLCESVSFPFFTFNTTQSFVNNKKNNVINSIDFDPVSFIFRVDSNKKILKWIDDWKNAIIDENQRLGYKDDYKCDIEIILLHLYDAEIASCTLQDAILVNVEPIEYSLESKDEISKISISVQYDNILYDNKDGKDTDIRSILGYF